MTQEGDQPDPPTDEPGTEGQEKGQDDKQTVKALVKSGVGETLDKLERTADLADVEKVQELQLKEKYGNTLLRMMAAQLFAVECCVRRVRVGGNRPGLASRPKRDASLAWGHRRSGHWCGACGDPQSVPAS